MYFSRELIVINEWDSNNISFNGITNSWRAVILLPSNLEYQNKDWHRRKTNNMKINIIYHVYAFTRCYKYGPNSYTKPLYEKIQMFKNKNILIDEDFNISSITRNVYRKISFIEIKFILC